MPNLTDHAYSYRSTLEASLRVNWQVADLIGDHKPLNFHKPFLPESLAGTETLSMLSVREKLLLNQIRGNSYLHLFGLVEEFILPFVMDYARTRLSADHYEVRSLLQFAEEEAKHIQLFEAFAEAFAKGFGVSCDVIGPAADFAQLVLEKSPLGVVLVILQIEWMTQQHYLEGIYENQTLDPQFSSLLRHHWMEEAQHAKLDTLIAEALFEAASPEEIEVGIADYIAILEMIDAGLNQQIEFDLVALEKASGRHLNEVEKRYIRAVQHTSYRYTFLVSGMNHPNFQKALQAISPEGAIQVSKLAEIFQACPEDRVKSAVLG